MRGDSGMRSIGVPVGPDSRSRRAAGALTSSANEVWRRSCVGSEAWRVCVCDVQQWLVQRKREPYRAARNDAHHRHGVLSVVRGWTAYFLHLVRFLSVTIARLYAKRSGTAVEAPICSCELHADDMVLLCLPNG